MAVPPLSVSLITLNEAENLRRCLESVRGLAAEIVVVDSGSADDTRAVADEFQARWFEQKWLGFREQKNLSLDHCQHDWVLCLDADEALSPELAEAIRQFLGDPSSANFAGAYFPRRTWFLGRWIRHGDWYPDHCLRLFRRGAGRWAGTSEHTKVELAGATKELTGDLLHWSFPTLRRFVEKQLSYADSFAERATEEGRQWNLWDNVTRPLWRFFRGYILRGGFLDGFPGLWVAVGNAHATFVRYSRLYEHRVAPPHSRKGQS
jgi:glycosyltransferase involved in cell wall biosynthesis